MRYLPLTETDRKQMLAFVGVKSIDDLYADVPNGALLKKDVDLPKAQGELEVTRHLQNLSEKNTPADARRFSSARALIVITCRRASITLIQRSEFLTAYTPYQPEIAQGTLQALYEFQSQVAHVARHGGRPTPRCMTAPRACAEAAMMAARVTKRKKIIFSGGVHPHYIVTTARTACEALGLEVVALPAAVDDEAAVTKELSAPTWRAVIVQSPNVFGTVTDLKPRSVKRSAWRRRADGGERSPSACRSA